MCAPSLESLSADTVTAVREKLNKSLGLPKDASGLLLARALRAASTLASDKSIESDGHALTSVVAGLAGGSEGFVLLNWGRWDDVDTMRLGDVVKHFSNLWYPKADDVDILDEDLKWLVSVDHDGWLYSTTLPAAGEPRA